jgi:hypothetical protein
MCHLKPEACSYESVKLSETLSKGIDPVAYGRFGQL